MIKGVNYASAGTAYLPQQIQQFTDTLQQFIFKMGEDAATNLISNFVFYISIGINNLCNLNVRKVVITGLAPIGCATYYLWQYGSGNGECAEQINSWPLNLTFSRGFSITSEACCGLGKYKGWIMCLSPEMACSNASYHIWWDRFHPTYAVNAILTDNIWNGWHT
ncbi:GDSL esterase/lipase [Glycine max]|nr:GDSL esterase/lipase [Glycine max]